MSGPGREHLHGTTSSWTSIGSPKRRRNRGGLGFQADWFGWYDPLAVMSCSFRASGPSRCRHRPAGLGACKLSRTVVDALGLIPAGQRYCCIGLCEHIGNMIHVLATLPTAPMFFAFPDDARWSAERQVVEFGVEIGEYHGVVRIPRRVFQPLLPDTPTPERCVEAYHLQRTRFERVAERSCGGVN